MFSYTELLKEDTEVPGEEKPKRISRKNRHCSLMTLYFCRDNPVGYLIEIKEHRHCEE